MPKLTGTSPLKYMALFATITVTVLCLFSIHYRGKDLTEKAPAKRPFAIAQNGLRYSNSCSKGIEQDKRLPKRKIHVPKFMLELYKKNRQLASCLHCKEADVIRSVLPKSTGALYNSEMFSSFQESHVLIFQVPPVDSDETFSNADLRILTLVQTQPNSVDGVERIVRVSVYDDFSNRYSSWAQKRLRHFENTWIIFNMTEPVKAVMKVSSETPLLKIAISIRAFVPLLNSTPSGLKLSLLPVSDDLEHDYPILVLSYTSKKTDQWESVRNKREADEDDEESVNRILNSEWERKANARKVKRLKNGCRKKPLYVDFTEIQYDSWIIQPEGYESYQCSGKCFYPIAEHLSPTKHAIIQNLVHNAFPAKAARSCCVPTKLDSISLLYIDDFGVLTYRLEYRDMVVVECGCR